MSFWNKIGLPSFTDVAQLQKEVRQLGNENSSQFEQLSLKADAIKKDISTLGEQNIEQVDSIVRYLETVIRLQEHLNLSMQNQLSQLLDLQNGISEALSKMQKDNSCATTEHTQYMLTLLEKSTHISKQINKTQAKLDEITSVKDYMYSLWEAMKLVWVNDLIELQET